MPDVTPAHAPTHRDPSADLATVRLGVVQQGHAVVRLPGTDYRLDLVIDGHLAGRKQGDRVQGTIRAQAQRVDVIPAGGRYIEPVFGRPRRLQGRIVAGDLDANTLTVNPAVPIVCRLNEHQHARDFAIGQLVSFDVEAGTTFTLAGSART